MTCVESCTTDLLHCDIYVGPHNGTYTKYYDHRRDKGASSGAEFYRWFYVWCLPASIGSTVKIEYTYKRTVFESRSYAILSLCEVEVYGRIRPCASNPCQNEGTCRLVDGNASVVSYECSCPVDWIGSNCDVMVPCTSNPCANGGTCNSNDTSYACFCQAEWTGINCEQKKVEGMPTKTKLLIGAGIVGAVAVATGAAVAGAGYFASGAVAHSQEAATKFGGMALSKGIRKGLAENVMAIFDDVEDDDDEEEGYSLWDAVCESVSSLVKEVSDAVNPDPAQTDQHI